LFEQVATDLTSPDAAALMHSALEDLLGQLGVAHAVAAAVTQ